MDNLSIPVTLRRVLLILLDREHSGNNCVPCASGSLVDHFSAFDLSMPLSAVALIRL
ncbi:hypothetical protein SynA1825c_01332 [Synechococcus sp. A18-25c]|nr:hypothetical protein SynA1825c_01332 [Synechococcus sp. A18-25c]